MARAALGTDIPPAPLEELRRQVFEEMRALSAADAYMDEAAAAVLGIHTTDLHAGEILERHGPMTIGELAEAVGLTPGSATALVDRLERAGFAKRKPDPQSRRRILVHPAKEAGKRSFRIFKPLVQKSDDLLGTYNAEELRGLRDFLRGARGVMEDHTKVLRQSLVESPTSQT